MTLMFGIRRATVDDAPGIADVHHRSAMAAYSDIFPPEAPAPTRDRLDELWHQWLDPADDLERRGFVAELEGESVGVVMTGRDSLDRSTGHLARMYVAPERWGQGIGRALYDVAVDRLSAVGHRRASLWVLEDNHRARSWYERLGWVTSESGTRCTRPPRSASFVTYWL